MVKANMYKSVDENEAFALTALTINPKMEATTTVATAVTATSEEEDEEEEEEE